MNSIATENLAVACDGNFVVSELELQIPRGKITTIIGANGCGKSRVLEAVGCILKPKNGMQNLGLDDPPAFSTI
ncbi:ABC transporter-like protein [Mycobacterium tuberculosis]|nr:ABC transporter-like protein [Mycobacterium tuberculosis]